MGTRRGWDSTKQYYIAVAITSLLSVCAVVAFALSAIGLGAVLLAITGGGIVVCQFLARRDLAVRIEDTQNSIRENQVKLTEILGINDQINLALTQELWFIRDTALELSRGITIADTPDNLEPLADASVRQPDVSIVIPVYNAARWLTECLDSILRQTGVLTEVICINDGSTDQSAQMLSEYSRQFSNIKVITQANAGLSVARNAGITAATGRYLVFVDDDDYWRTNQLAELVHYADLHNLDLLLFNVIPFPALGVSSKQWESYPKYYWRHKEYPAPRSGLSLAATMKENGDYFTAAWQYLIATHLLHEYQLAFIPGIIHEDHAFTFQTFIAAKRAAQLAIPLYARRIRPGSIMTTRQPSKSAQGLYVAADAMTQSLNEAAHKTDHYEYQQLEQIIDNTREAAQHQESQVSTSDQALPLPYGPYESRAIR